MSIDALARSAARDFAVAFGHPPDRLAFAPGRVNLIGEHTDYNGGFVLPVALGPGTVVALSARNDDTVLVHAPDMSDAPARFPLGKSAEAAAPGHWSNHVRGLFAARAASGLANRGAELLIRGNLPRGAGLSSSASLGVALGLGLAALQEEVVDPQQLARLAQWSEHHVVGCQCGIMDQLVSAAAVEGHALLIDCDTLARHLAPLPAGLAVVVVDSGIVRGLVDSAYNARRRECEQAARHYGVPKLRALDAAQLLAGREGLDETCFRRARHVVSENARTLEAVSALQGGDLGTLGRLLRASHASLRDDFEVSVPGVDALAAAMNAGIGPEGGARMTGGGFGGCLVALLPEAAVPALRATVDTHFAAKGERTPLFLVASAGGGARLLPLPGRGR